MIKSPLKNTAIPNKCLDIILQKIPQGSVVDSFVLFSGQLEISLAQYNRFVCAHTNKYAVYEFWYSLMMEPKRIYDVVTSDKFKFQPDMFEILQEKWVEYKDPIIRSALFFMLNQASDTGAISSGKLVHKPMNPLSLANLRAYEGMENLHFILDKDSEITDTINSKLLGQYVIVSCGNFSYNLFEESKNIGYDMTNINHKKLRDVMKSSDKNIMLIYNYDKRLHNFFKNNKITYVDKYGKQTEKRDNAVEVIIANF